MGTFKPYQISHIDLQRLGETVVSSGNQYLILYYKHIPLGHLLLSGSGQSAALYAEIFRAITPAVDYYSDQAGIELPAAIREDFERGSPLPLLQVLEKICVAPKALENNSLSVVICTRNRPDDITRCVRNLLESTDTDFELIVVDNAPDNDLTEKALRQFPSVKYIKEPKKGLDNARNTGARQASGSIIAYTDDDVSVSRNWTAQLRSCFNDPMTMAVTGLVMPASLEKEAQYLFEKNWGFNKGYIPLVFDHLFFKSHYHQGIPAWEVGAGANMAFRRQAFEIAGFFDERLDVGASGCSGDSEMWYRIIAEGWTCRYFPHLFVHHHHRKTNKELSKQLYAYMRGNISSILVQYEKYGHPGEKNRVFRAMPRYYLDKVKQSLKTFSFAELPGLLNEISGAIAGWQFYQKNQRPRQPQRTYTSLYNPVEIAPDDLVSVVIPCYNHAGYLTAAIESVRNQSYLHTEIILVDDGSTDETANVAKNYPEIRYLHANRVGLSAARNLGLRSGKGKYVIFLDADDFLMPDAIQVHLTQLSAHPYAAFVSGAHQRVDHNGNPLPGPTAQYKEGDCYTDLLQGNFIAMEGSVLYRRALFDAFTFDPALKACEDYDLNLRITRHFPILTHQHISAAYRIHPDNMSKNTNMMLSSALTVIQKQVPYLRTPQEKTAFDQGVRNWTAYYLTEKVN